jgi:hypothetical protein
MYKIPTYKNENKISDIVSIGSSRLECKLLTDINEKTKDFINNQAIANLKLSCGSLDFDLFTVYSLLVSTGWNGNTDVFLKDEIYNSYYTPINKPFNVEHIPNKIIGHMTNTCLVDDEYNPIDMSLAIDEISDKLHILNSSVIYRHIGSRDPKWEQQVANWIKEIKNGDWFVSMEVLFKNFDYSLIDSNGVEEIIQRNSETSHMSHSLVFYGGNSIYNGKRIGRVLRNITFSGMGLVRKPANKESVISSDPGVFNNIFASINKESDEIMTQEQITKLETELAETKAKLVETEGQLNTARASEAELVTLKTEILTIKDTLNIKDASIAELTVKVKSLETAKADVDNQLVKSQEELNAMKAQALKETRLNALRASADFADDELTAILEQYMSFSDEQFNAVINTLAKKCKKEVANVNVEIDKVGEAATTATVLENIEVENDPKLANDGVNNEEIEQAKAHLSGFLGNLINQKTKK